MRLPAKKNGGKQKKQHEPHACNAKIIVRAKETQKCEKQMQEAIVFCRANGYDGHNGPKAKALLTKAVKENKKYVPFCFHFCFKPHRVVCACARARAHVCVCVCPPCLIRHGSTPH